MDAINAEEEEEEEEAGYSAGDLSRVPEESGDISDDESKSKYAKCINMQKLEVNNKIGAYAEFIIS